jgi:hypothetical protein
MRLVQRHEACSTCLATNMFAGERTMSKSTRKPKDPSSQQGATGRNGITPPPDVRTDPDRGVGEMGYSERGPDEPLTDDAAEDDVPRE